MFLLNSLWRGLKGLPKLIFPFFARARELRHPGQKLRWALRLLVLASVLVLLTFINLWADLPRVLRAPLPLLRNVWLPLLFLLIYTMSWLIWWLWELLTSEQENSEFPDIDDAWEAVLRALEQASIDITQSPLFLILGSPAGSEEALLNASKLALEVGRTPQGADAPLHAYANREGIYITCPGASLLARKAQLLAERTTASKESTAAPLMAGSTSSREADQATRAHGSALSLSEALGTSPFEPGVLGRQPEPEPTKGQVESSPPELPNTSSPRRASLIMDHAEVDRISQRLQHLGRLIARSRRPYCPANGILLLIPFAATDSADESDELGALCQLDRISLRESLQVLCPSFAAICDMEQVPGFRSFVARFPEAQRAKVLGLDLPLVPAVDESGFARMLHDSIGWIGHVLIPTLVYRLWSLEVPGLADEEATLRENIQLHQVLARLRERQERIYRILARAFASEPPSTTLFGGCYLAATGRDSSHEQAFVASIFRRLVENQNYVSWTSEALAEDADYRRWALIGWGWLVVLLLTVVGLAYAFWIG